jgi:predicted nicotinamide N-methyase
MDLGAGWGIVGIVAAQAGAAQAGAAWVIAADIDPVARVVTALNAVAYGIQVEVGEDDYLSHPERIGATGAEVILAGDLFHDSALAR